MRLGLASTRFTVLAITLIVASCASTRSGQDSRDGRATAQGPMTDLHRYVEHDKLSPLWDELQTDHLGDRLFLFHSVSVGDRSKSTTTVIADERSTRCRISRIHWNKYGVRGTILFEHGSTNPVGYTGAGLCATQPSVSNSLNTGWSDVAKCHFSEESSISLHGLAWRGERDSDGAATSLSRRRAEYIRKHLEGTALPQKVTGLVAHGTDRSDVKVSAEDPVPGVYLAIDNPRASNAEDPFEFHDRVGPPIPREVRSRLDSFMASHASQPDMQIFRGHRGHTTLKYVAPAGNRVRSMGSTSHREAMWAVHGWAEALTKAGCRYDEVKEFEAFLP